MSKKALLIWRLSDDLKVFNELISQGYKLEAKGRELATRRDEDIGYEDSDWADGLAEWHENVLRLAEDTEVPFTKDDIEVMRYLYEDSSTIAGRVHDIVYYKGKHKRSEPIITYADVYFLARKLRDYNDAQMRVTGRSGIWLLNKVMTESDYTFSAFLNDYTSCFHQFLNYLNQKVGSLREVAPKVYATMDATPLTIRIGTWWSEAVQKYNKWGLYWEEDYPSLFALCKENNVEFRVGSAEGHATHVNAGLLFATAEYYDKDENVHWVFTRLCEHYGCVILEHREYELTIVRIPRPHMGDFFQGVLPFVTSMDVRLREGPDYYWVKYFCGDVNELKEKGYEGEELEYRLCLKAYERFESEKAYGFYVA
jgi:hypothetical protein